MSTEVIKKSHCLASLKMMMYKKHAKQLKGREAAENEQHLFSDKNQ
jgi:hypothetical protein